MTTTQSLDTRRESRTGWTVLIVLCLAQFMVALDATVVNVALPSISGALDLSGTDAQWVITSYLLCTGGLTLLGGRVADEFGRRRTLLIGLALFAAASLASGTADQFAVLVVARGAQGVGAALLTPAALAVLTTTYTDARRTAALATWGAVGASGFAAGLLIGGMLTTWLSWRWIFFINLAVVAVAATAVPALVPRDPAPSGRLRTLAPAAPLAVTAGLICLVYAISTSTTHGWSAITTITMLVASAVLIGVFGVLERFGSRPFVPRPLWRRRPLLAGAGLMAGATALLAGTLVLTTFVLQQRLGASPLRTGLDYLPFAVVIGLAAHVGPHLLERWGTRAVAVTGLLIVAGGEGLLIAAPDDASYLRWFLLAFVVLGAGTGLTFVAASVTAMSDVGAAHAGAASGLLTTGHEIGGGLGIAVLTTIATTQGVGVVVTNDGGYVTAAIVAAALALGAAVAVPNRRPTGVTPLALH